MSGPASSSLRTLLVGIDAACLPVVEPLFEDGDLPTLRALFTDGTGGSLKSQIPPWTASAWPSLYTGMNPGKHGVFGFLEFEGYDWDVVNATSVSERGLWELLDWHGLTSVVVNVPVTEPPRPFDGALIPGYTAHEDPAAHPEGILGDVRDAIGDYRMYSEGKLDDDAVDQCQSFVRMRGEAFRYLANSFDPDFGFLQFQQTDTIFHESPGDDDLVRAVYREVDRQIAQTLDACDPATVIVVSDHGIGRCEGREFRVNELLRDEGFVETTVDESGMPTWVTLREQQLQGETSKQSRAYSVLGSAVRVAAAFGMTIQRVTRLLEALGLTDVVASLIPDDVQRAGTEQVDFEESRAYMRDSVELGVRINLEGREPAGTVPESDYEAVRRELIDALESVTTPGGEPVFEDVAPREEYFQGPHTADAVDIVTVPADFNQYLSAQLYRKRFGEPTEPYTHKRHGLIAARGPTIDTTVTWSEAHLFDVAPTVLSTLDVPWDERMDGSPLPFVTETDPRQYPSVEPRDRLQTDDETVEKRLADLGYIERQ